MVLRLPRRLAAGAGLTLLFALAAWAFRPAAEGVADAEQEIHYASLRYGCDIEAT
jgi:hypothetical protein